MTIPYRTRYGVHFTVLLIAHGLEHSRLVEDALTFTHELPLSQVGYLALHAPYFLRKPKRSLLDAVHVIRAVHLRVHHLELLEPPQLEVEQQRQHYPVRDVPEEVHLRQELGLLPVVGLAVPLYDLLVMRFRQVGKVAVRNTLRACTPRLLVQKRKLPETLSRFEATYWSLFHFPIVIL